MSDDCAFGKFFNKSELKTLLFDEDNIKYNDWSFDSSENIIITPDNCDLVDGGYIICDFEIRHNGIGIGNDNEFVIICHCTDLGSKEKSSINLDKVYKFVNLIENLHNMKRLRTNSCNSLLI